MITPNPLLGTSLHGLGALSASVCYTPQKAVRRWSWQTYWLAQASFCWLILPVVCAFVTIPELRQVLAEAPPSAMKWAFLYGMAYGIGGTAFGISIRYIGFSLTYAIAVGLSSVLGTLIPPLVDGKLIEAFSKPGAGWIQTGICLGTLGIALCGAAGRLKEIDLADKQAEPGFSLGKGLALSLLAGVLSAVYEFALHAGEPIADVAEKHGADIFKGNVVYIFSNTGAFVTTALYCLYLGIRQQSLSEFIYLPADAEAGTLRNNFALAILTGALWFGQFFFYNLGHVHMGGYQFTSWAIHMIMLVLFSTLIALLWHEWSGCRRPAKTTIAVALLMLVLAVLSLTRGNYIGGQTPSAATQPASTQPKT